jgi:hypothetical protein
MPKRPDGYSQPIDRRRLLWLAGGVSLVATVSGCSTEPATRSSPVPSTDATAGRDASPQPEPSPS